MHVHRFRLMRWPPIVLAALLTNSAAHADAGTDLKILNDAGDAAAPLIRQARHLMGTICTVAVQDTDENRVDQAATAAFAEMSRLEALMTTWRPTSDVSRVNAAAGRQSVVVAPETFAVIKQALWIAKLSDGAFDITVGAFSGLWKFDEDNDGSIPTTAAVRDRLRLVNWRDVLVDTKTRAVRLRRPGQRITLGGIAKGFAVDAAVATLRSHGLQNFIVQCGGDMFAAGLHANRPWRVGIQDPRMPPANSPNPAASIGTVALSNQAFNTSGDYERFVIRNGRRYHHILDPKTGYPVDHTRAVSILAPSSFLADTVDTTVFVLGARRGLALLRHHEIANVDGLVVDAHNQVHISPGFKPKLTELRPPTDGL